MTQLYQELTSDTALYAALFLGGGGAFAWTSYLLEKLDNRSDKWALNGLSNECENLAKVLEGPALIPFGLGSNTSINKKLVRFGFEPIPIKIDRKDKDARARAARYLRAIGPAMTSDLDFALELGVAALNLNRAKAVARRSPLNTESWERQ